MKTVLSGLMALFLIAVPAPSIAQVPPTIDIAGPMANTILNRNLLDRRLADRRSTSEPTRPRESVDPGAFRYTADPARTQANLRLFIANTPNAESRAELQRIVSAQPTIIEEIRTGIRPYGFDGSNVADAYAMWWINSWLAANERNDDPPRATLEAVKRQVYAAFAVTPGLADADDSERQRYAEALLLQGAIIASIAELGASDPALRGDLAQFALQSAANAGLDLSAMVLTEEGFVPR